MSFSLSSIISKPFSSPQNTLNSTTLLPITRIRNRGLVTKCELNDQESTSSSDGSLKLGIGSPVIITEAPKMIKTAASVPCLRVNADLVKAGDVGRIVSRKPMDVWAVRLRLGTYLIDRKYFKPLELDE